MIYFEKELKPTIINRNINEKKIQKWCDENGVYLKITDNSTYWAGFANFYGKHHGLSVIESGSFAYIVSLYFGGMGVSCETDAYFRESDIDYRILGVYSELKNEITDEEELAINLFYKIFDLYKNDIEQFSFKIHPLNFRLSESDYSRFMGVDGDTKADKLRTLLAKYYK